MIAHRLRRSMTNCAALIALAGACVVSSGCERRANPCEGVSCSDQGMCFSTNGTDALCACFQNYVPVGGECVENSGCAGVTCEGHGQCIEADGIAVRCDCSNGYTTSPDGFHCFVGTPPDGDADSDTDADWDEDGDGDGPVECDSDEQCTEPTAARCHPTERHCVPCNDHSQCEAGVEGAPFCVDELWVCVGCMTSDDCDEDSTVPICDPVH